MKKQIILPIAVAMALTNFANAKTFSDVPSTYPAYVEAIDKLSNSSVISGYPDGTFKPANTITRAEVAKMIVVAYDLKMNPQKEVSFTDAEGKWYEEYIRIAGSNDILHGYLDGTVKPNNQITYAELSAVLNRILEIHTSTVKEEGESWHSNSWQASEEAGLFNNIATNDLLPDAKARRDNVALMIYNSLNYKAPSEEDKKEEVKPSGEEVKPSGEAKKEIDTNKIYFGVVDDRQLVRGRDTVDVDMFNDEIMTFTVKNFDDPPKDEELIFLKIRKSGSTNVLRELVVQDLNEAYLVTEVDDEDGYAKLKDQTEWLDLEEDDYMLSGDKITFGKMNYFIIDVSRKKNNYYFDDGKQITIEEVSFSKDDRIIIDKDKKLFIIFRGLESDEVIK